MLQESDDEEQMSQFPPSSSAAGEKMQYSDTTSDSECTPLNIRRKNQKVQAEKQEALVNEVLLTVKEHFKKPRTTEDRFDVICKTVAMKLRELPKHQMLIAEKLINDTLFQAEMGNLTLPIK